MGKTNLVKSGMEQRPRLPARVLEYFLMGF